MSSRRPPLVATLCVLALSVSAEDSAPVVGGSVLVVTASQRAEDPADLAATVRVITPEPAVGVVPPSLTDLLAQHAIGFLSEWSPAQTSLNMRGAASDGQGRDFRSQVLVLLNGRRAGTANLSKLGSSDIERIEIVRGPGSVIHGSQAMGGVINLITADGRSRTGGRLGVQTGSWGRLGAGASYGLDLASGADVYIGLNWLRRDDHDAGRGGGVQENSDFERLGGTLGFGFALAEHHRLELITRSDGTLDAGFRGSSYDIDNREARRNTSQELIYTGALAEDALAWTVHPYAILDEDDFRWGSEAAGIDTDDNHRKLWIIGSRQHVTLPLTAANTLVAGVDVERSRLRSTRARTRLDGAPVSQLAPFDANSDSLLLGLYVEDAQRLWDERVVVRGGLRSTWGREGIVQTPNAPLFAPRTESYHALTWSTGVAWHVVDHLTLRANAATGYRAPTATELALDFTSVLGGQILGNPNLDAESNLGLEIGGTWRQGMLWADLALFRNAIRDRIRSVPQGGGVSRWENSDAEAIIEGVEAAVRHDVAPALGWTGWVARIDADATWHWRMEDEDANPAIADSDKIQRMYVYQGALGVTVGQERSWDIGLRAILRGPMYYDTEERLLIPAGEPAANFIHRKDPFWVLNLAARWYARPTLTVWAAVNNLLDENNHPIYIATDEQPYISNPAFTNGGRGNSMPGREFVTGVDWRF